MNVELINMAGLKRPKQFAKLSDRLEKDYVLIVTKLDRLGRCAMDMQATVESWLRQACEFTALP